MVISSSKARSVGITPSCGPLKWPTLGSLELWKMEDVFPFRVPNGSVFQGVNSQFGV